MTTRRAVGALLALLFLGAPVSAQDVASISGVVTTRADGAPGAGAGDLLAVGAQNLFDVFPDRNTTVNSFNGIQTFPSHSLFGMNGRALYARVGRTF